MALERLEPRGVAELLGDAISAYRRQFKPLLALSVTVGVPMTLITSFMLWASNKVAPAPMDPETADLAELGRFMWEVAVSTAVSSVVVLIAVVLWSVATAAWVRGASRGLAGEGIDVMEACSFAVARFRPLLGAVLLSSSLLSLLAVTIIGIPLAVYFFVTWAFIIETVVLEGQRTRQALSRSSALVKGNWWRVVGFALLAFIVVGVPSLLLYYLGSVVSGGNVILSNLLSSLLMLLLAPIGAVASVLMYFDLRVRKEEYTLAKLKAEVGGAPTAP